MIRLLIGFIILLSSAACSAQKQTISGSVFWIEGDQMPGPGRVGQKKGIAREIYFYEPVKAADLRRSDGLYQTIPGKLIAKTTSNEAGYFSLKLHPGKYSVFTREDNGFFANTIDKDGNTGTVDVTKKQKISLVIEVNYKAAF